MAESSSYIDPVADDGKDKVKKVSNSATDRFAKMKRQGKQTAVENPRPADARGLALLEVHWRHDSAFMNLGVGETSLLGEEFLMRRFVQSIDCICVANPCTKILKAVAMLLCSVARGKIR